LQVDVEWVVSQLLDRSIVAADEAAPGHLRFTREIYRAAAAGSMAPKDAQRLHSRIGQYLEDTGDLRDPRTLQASAFHHAAGSDPERGARFLLRAARRLMEVHQLDTAASLLEQLVKLAAPEGYENYVLSKCENELDEGLYHLGMARLRRGLLEE